VPSLEVDTSDGAIYSKGRGQTGDTGWSPHASNNPNMFHYTAAVVGSDDGGQELVGGVAERRNRWGTGIGSAPGGWLGPRAPHRALGGNAPGAMFPALHLGLPLIERELF
jgi:hypothetical protein